MLKSLFFLVFIIFFPLHGLIANPLPLTFDHLIVIPGENEDEQFERLHFFNDQFIKIRGFLYQTEQNEFILASQPDLKSCCVGQPSKLSQQIKIKGNIESDFSHHVVTIEGIFKIDPKYDRNGKTIQLYVLEQAQISGTTFGEFPWKTLGGIALLLFVLFPMLIRIRHRPILILD